MRLPPLVARVRIRTPDHHLRLWVPLFLVWVLLLPLLVPLALLVALAALLAPPRWRFGPVARGACVALCETRGVAVDVEGPRSRFLVTLH
jgi:hypothetical protein